MAGFIASDVWHCLPIVPDKPNFGDDGGKNLFLADPGYYIF